MENVFVYSILRLYSEEKVMSRIFKVNKQRSHTHTKVRRFQNEPKMEFKKYINYNQT